MKPSEEALALAEKIANGEKNYLDSISMFSDFWVYFHIDSDWGYPDYGRKHRSLALCLYAAILQDDGR